METMQVSFKKGSLTATITKTGTIMVDSNDEETLVEMALIQEKVSGERVNIMRDAHGSFLMISLDEWLAMLSNLTRLWFSGEKV